MRTLISAIALAFAFSAPSFADDAVKTNPDPAKPGRAIEGEVKAGNSDVNKVTRKIEGDGALKTKKATTKRQGRAIDKAKKKAAVENKQGRALDGEVKTGKEGTEKQGRAIDGEVKSGKEGTDKQGRAIEASK